jgi:LysR family positive regulator for ilvC
MNLEALKVFLHLSESLHFGQTSAACYLSPSAVSRQIKRLEDEVGHKLFERDNRSVELTPAGMAFQAFARDVQTRWSEFSTQVNQEAELMAGEIRIYASVTACHVLLPKYLRHYRRAYPRVHLKLMTGAAGVAPRMVIENKVDISVIAQPDKLPDSLAFKELLLTPLVLAEPKQPASFKKKLRQDPIPWDEIPLILAREGLARDRAEAWFRQMGLKPRIYATVSGNEAILALVGLGCGLGVVPEVVMHASPFKDDVQPFEAEHRLSPYRVGFCVKRRKLLQRQVKAFWELSTERVQYQFKL